MSCTDQVEVVNFWPTPSRKLTVVSVLIFQFENKKQEQQLYFFHDVQLSGRKPFIINEPMLKWILRNSGKLQPVLIKNSEDR